MKEMLLSFCSGKNTYKVLFPCCWQNKKEDSKLKIVKRLFNQLGLEENNPSFFEEMVKNISEEDYDFVLDSNGYIKKSVSPYYKKQ